MPGPNDRGSVICLFVLVVHDGFFRVDEFLEVTALDGRTRGRVLVEHGMCMPVGDPSPLMQ